jgi:hypothetical protein
MYVDPNGHWAVIAACVIRAAISGVTSLLARYGLAALVPTWHFGTRMIQ